MTLPSDSPIDSPASELEPPSTPPTQEPSKEKAKEKTSPQYEQFLEKLRTLPTPEEKIAEGLLFMRSSISQEGSPRFREFWEGRKLLLPFFKENLNLAIRSKLWDEYVELTVEARKLKEILEEQSAFAMEQISLAIGSLETEVANFGTLLAQAPLPHFQGDAYTMREKRGFYETLQRELSLLNILASRLNALRKEVIHTDMRIRQKNEFLKRLSASGDQIFPKRKELIEKVSAEFEKDVERFISNHFSGGEAKGQPYYALRSEIKALQQMAKEVTLSSGAFSRTRLRLSQCWDQMKALETAHKKEELEQKQASSAQRSEIEALIKALDEKVKEAGEAMTLKELDGEIEKISEAMRPLPLHRDDVRALRDEMSKLRAPLLALQQQKVKELEEAEKERMRLKKEKTQKLKEEIAHLAQEEERLELEPFAAAFDKILSDLASLEATKMEKQQLERLLRPLKDALAEKKERSLLNLSEDEKKTLEMLRQVLQQKKERLYEIKQQIELYRKARGGSDLDLEKAMQYAELLEQEKERLEKANQAIREVEERIAELEG